LGGEKPQDRGTGGEKMEGSEARKLRLAVVCAAPGAAVKPIRELLQTTIKVRLFER
jgi:hypothetical protein